MQNKTKNTILCALFAALTGVFSQISIPIPITPVPINLATLSVCIVGGLLGAKRGAISQLVYVIIGLIGIPVFANFGGGVGRIVGPTGGYIVGYVVAATIIGIIIDKFGDKLQICIIAMSIGILGCYIVGTAWFMFVTKNTLAASLYLCVVPFLIGDVLKVIMASILVKKLKKHVK